MVVKTVIKGSPHRCKYCPDSITNIVLTKTRRSSELLRAQTSFDIGYDRESKAYYEFDVVQCTKCGAESPIVHGGSPSLNLWRKKPRWWSDIDGRFESRLIKQREAARRSTERRQKQSERYREQIDRDKSVAEIVSKFWATRPMSRLEFLSKLETSHGLKPDKQFEILIGQVFARNGYRVKITGSPGDRGIDVLASKYGETFPFQCKRRNKKVTDGHVREFFGALDVHGKENVGRGVIISVAGFSKPAIKSATEVPNKNVLLVDSGGLNLMLADFEYFERKYLLKSGIKTAFDGPLPPPTSPSPRPARPRKPYVKRACLAALAIVPEDGRPQVGKSKSGYFWKREKRIPGAGELLEVRYYCLYVKNDKVHQGECKYDAAR